MRFSYTAKDIGGKTITGTDDAPDQQSLVARLQKQGYFVVSCLPFAETLAKKSSAKNISKTKFTHNKVDMDDLLIFARQMATMLDAGVNLLRSLDVISGQIESRQLYNTLIEVRRDVEHGSSLRCQPRQTPKSIQPILGKPG